MYFSVILLVSIALGSFADVSVSSAEDEASSSVVTGWIEGTDTESGKPTKLYFSNETESEIILEQLKDVSVHCEAHFPVQLDFKSHGGFKLLATGSGSASKSYSNGTHNVHVQKYTTYAHLVSLKEAYTGLYTCRGRGSKTKKNAVSAFIYVPSDKFFVSFKSGPISTLGLKAVAIPCPVSNPKASVTLVQWIDDTTVKPVPEAKYNSRSGFSVDGANLSGTFFCVAEFNGSTPQAVEFQVTNESLTCTQRCPANSACQVVNDQQVCECKPNFRQTFVSNKCILECKTDKDCPFNMACLPQESGSFLVDILTSIESRQEDTDDEQEIKRGECKNPCIYKTSCSGTCQIVDHKPNCNEADRL